jgi:CRISPR-associated endonuclease/helicase Cas3
VADRPDFASFFRACIGSDPFPWQQQAARRLAGGLGGDEQLTVAVPTGLGKTGLLVCWAWALAASEPGPGRRVPMRLVHVSPRRAIVEDVFALAERIAAVLEDPEHNIDRTDFAARDSASWAAQRLLAFTGGEGIPLLATQLRGGVRTSRAWREGLDQPGIIVATADMAGSAILFRHWLASPGARPVLAALVGVDAAWIIDEGHLQVPLTTTIKRLRQADRSCLGLPWWLIETTATPATNTVAATRLTSADRDHPVARRRLGVTRTLTIHPTKTSPSPQPSVQRLAALALAAGENSENRSVLVVTNSPGDARRVWALLADQVGDPGRERVLLVHGEQREVDRTMTMGRAREGLGMRAVAGGPTWYLVGTSAIEAGADLSADHLVTQSCPADSLIQRLGRLGRRADRTWYTGDLVPTDETATPASKGNYWERYENAARDTVAALKRLGEPGTGERKGLTTVSLPADARLDMSGLSAPRGTPVPLWSADLAALVQTRPAPIDDPDVDELIHGIEDRPVTASLAWRCDLEPGAEDQWEALVRGWPVRPHELAEIRLRDLDLWLGTRPCLLTDTDGGSFRLRTPAGSLRAHSVVVVPGSYGGHDGFGFNPSCHRSATDVADLATDHPKGPRIRLLPHLLPVSLRGVLDGDEEVGDEQIKGTLEDLAAAEDGIGGVAVIATGVLGQRWDWQYRADGTVGVTVASPSFDAGNELCAREEVSLCDHSTDVAARGMTTARRVGVPERYVEAVGIGGLLHDLGKADPATQRSMRAANDVIDDRLLGKSGVPRRLWRQRSVEAEVPVGSRHEALSGALAALVSDDLAAHLAAASHGYGRPWFPAVAPGEPYHLTVAIEALDGGAEATVDGNPYQTRPASQLTGRFVDLNDEIGPWELAWLEAAVRLADQAASASPRHRAIHPTPATASARAPRSHKPQHDDAKGVLVVSVRHDIAADWLAALGALTCYQTASGHRQVTMRWLRRGPWWLPEIIGGLDAADLGAAITRTLNLLATTWLDEIVDRRPGESEVLWRRNKLSAPAAADLQEKYRLGRHVPGSPEAMVGLYATPPSRRLRNSADEGVTVRTLSQLVCGTNALVDLRSVQQMAETASESDLPLLVDATLGVLPEDIGEWYAHPVVEKRSLGFDRGTTANAHDGNGTPVAYPVRDILALIGSSWRPSVAHRDTLACPIWEQPLTPADISHLIVRPELRDHRPTARRLLRQWGVAEICNYQTRSRAAGSGGGYKVWDQDQPVSLQ